MPSVKLRGVSVFKLAARDPQVSSLTAKTLRIAGFSTISYVVSYSSQLVDMFWLARLSVGVPTAIAIISTVFIAVLTLNEVVGVSSVALISQANGAGNDQRTASVILQTLLMKLLMGMLMAAGFLWFLHNGLHWYQLDPVVADYIHQYGKIIWLSLILAPCSASVLTSLRILNEAASTAWISVLALSTNAVLTPLLIYGLWGFPALGLAGAAWATIAVDSLVLLIGLRQLWYNRAGVRFVRQSLNFKRSLYLDLLLIGLPVAGVVFLMNAEQLIITAIVAQQPVSVSDGFGIAHRLFGLIYISTLGMAVGVAVVAGEAIGSDRHAVLQRALLPVMIRLAVATLVMCGLVAAVANPLLRLFTTDPIAIDTAVVYLRFMSLAMLFYCLHSVIHGVFEGAGRNMPILLVALAVYGGIEFPVLWWLSQMPALPLHWIWLTVVLCAGLLAIGLLWLHRLRLWWR